MCSCGNNGVRILSESQQQAAVVSWFRSQYPQYKPYLFSIPNGSHLAGDKLRRIKQVSKLKKEGFKNGVSDLFLSIPSAHYHGLYLEMKDIGKRENSLTEEQAQHLEDMARAGYRATWAAGAEQAIRVIRLYMSEVRDVPM